MPEVDLDVLKEAKRTLAFGSAQLKHSIKLKPDAAKIAICIPIGDKDDPDMFRCEKCKKASFGIVMCPHCKAENEARKKLRRAGLITVEFWAAMQQIVSPLLTSQQMFWRKSVLSAQAREEMTHEAMGSKYIWYVDDDTLPPAKALLDMHRMMEITPDAAAITGIYCTREKCQEPLIYAGHGQGAMWDFSTKIGILTPIWAAGAGCTLARVEAIKDVKRLLDGPTWHDEFDMEAFDVQQRRTTWGHDIRFYDRLIRAGKMPGATRPWKNYAAGWIQCMHFDINTQTMYGLPREAPCFKNMNNKTYWDFIHRSHGQEMEVLAAGMKDRLYKRICELVPQGSKVVDVGCGIGVLLDRLAKMKQTDGYGYDLSEEAIGMLQSRWLKGEVQDVKDFQLNHFPSDETVLVSTEAVDHFDDARYDHFLSEARFARMAIISAINENKRDQPIEQGTRLRSFTPEEFGKDMARLGWPHVRVESIKPHHMLAICTQEELVTQ